MIYDTDLECHHRHQAFPETAANCRGGEDWKRDHAAQDQLNCTVASSSADNFRKVLITVKAQILVRRGQRHVKWSSSTRFLLTVPGTGRFSVLLVPTAVASILFVIVHLKTHALRPSGPARRGRRARKLLLTANSLSTVLTVTHAAWLFNTTNPGSQHRGPQRSYEVADPYTRKPCEVDDGDTHGFLSFGKEIPQMV